MNPEVTQYIEKLQPWQIEVCQALRKLIFENLTGAEERMQYGKPHYLKNGHYASVIQGSKDKVSFVIFNAAKLEDIKGFFQSTTSPDRKTATIKEGQEVDYTLLSKFLKSASDSL